MINLLAQIQGFQPLLLTVISFVFIMHLVMRKDELEEQAFANALKSAVLIISIAVIGFIFYSLLNNTTSISLYTLVYAIEIMSILTVVFYYLALTGYGFSFNLKNRVFANILLFISMIISILGTVSIVLDLELFANSNGLLRYDELLLFINLIMLGLIIPILPKRKKMYHEEYYRMQRQVNKGFNLAIIIYVVALALAIGIIISQKLM